MNKRAANSWPIRIDQVHKNTRGFVRERNARVSDFYGMDSLVSKEAHYQNSGTKTNESLDLQSSL